MNAPVLKNAGIGVVLRSILFNVAFSLWTMIPPIFMLWILPLPKPSFFYWIRCWQRAVAWMERNIAGIHYQVIGLEHLPSGPCIIGAKHQSAWETCKLHLLFGDPVILLKKELTSVPIWGWYARASGTIPIDRKSGVKALLKMKKAAQVAKEANKKIVIFPEGTRVPPGERRPYKSGIAVLYEELQLPIVPMALNSGLFWPKRSWLRKPGLITIEFLPPIPPGQSRAVMMRELQDKLETASDRLLLTAA